MGEKPKRDTPGVTTIRTAESSTRLTGIVLSHGPTETVDDHYGGPSPVGCYQPNGFNLYDMVGNVWQMCADYFDPKAYDNRSSSVVQDPFANKKSKKKVIRGGNWAFGPGIARNAFRFGLDTDTCVDLLGFRIASILGPDDPQLQENNNREALNLSPQSPDGIKQLFNKVRELLESGRRLEAKRLVDSISGRIPVEAESPLRVQRLVVQSLETLLDMTEDKSLQTFTNSLGMTLTHIPSGSFVMGSSEADISWGMSTLAQRQPVSLENEYPFHKVRISRPFYIAVTEITVGQFRAFVEDTGYVTDAEDAGGGQVFNTTDGRFEQKAGSSWKNPGWTVSDDQPVTMVSWNDAQAFVEWLSAKEKLPYRLPTEAQWEYASRGKLPFCQFSWGDSVPDGKRANYADRNTNFEWRDRDADDGYRYVAPVASFPPNGFGLYDMAGNVIEWVRDHYGEDYYRYSPEVDPEGPGHGENRVTKGGDWTFSAVGLRNAFRGWSRPDMAFYNTGFRVIVDFSNSVKPFHFASNFLTKEWVPGQDQRSVSEAVDRERDRKSKRPESKEQGHPPTSIEAQAEKGVLILSLTPKSDAKKAGLMQGDIIIEYDGVRNLTSEGLLALTAKTKKEKSKPSLIFIRDGQQYSVRVNPGFLGIAVEDAYVKEPLRQPVSPTDQGSPQDKNKKSKPPNWT